MKYCANFIFLYVHLRLRLFVVFSMETLSLVKKGDRLQSVVQLYYDFSTVKKRTLNYMFVNIDSK